jgi:hypothetical protein
MLVTFYCKGHANITFLGSVATALLHAMGHSGAVPGAILAADVPDALNQLQQFLKNSKPEHSDMNSKEDDIVSLSNRAMPLLNLLKAAIVNHSNVMWDF